MRSNTILCGNCADILPKLKEESFHFILTSPPYDGANMRKEKMIDLNKIGDALFRVLIPGGVCVLFIQDKFVSGGKSLTSFKTAINWAEKTNIKLWNDYIFYRGGMNGYWWDARPRLDHDYVFCFVKGNKPNHYNKKPFMKKNICGGTVLDYRTQKRKTRLKNKPKNIEFPIPYPIEIARDLIYTFTKPKEIILDPFIGTGTTAIAAKRTGRKYIGIELFPDVVKYANKRIKNETTGRLETWMEWD